jgi:hypothetical protein
MEGILNMNSTSWEILNELQSSSKTRDRDLVKVNRIQDQIKLFREKLNRTQTQLLKVNCEIKTKKENLKQHRKQKRENCMKDKYSKKSTQYSVWKNPKNFENVLEKKTTQFSFGQSKNRDRRREIDQMRREKMMRERININLEGDIEKVKEDIRRLGQVVEGLENRQKERRRELFDERKKVDDKSEIAKLGIKHVAERLQEENERTRVDFFNGISNWNRVNPSGLGGSTLYNSDMKEKKVEKQRFNEHVNMAERKKLLAKIKSLEEVLRMWFEATGTTDIHQLQSYIKSTSEENTVFHIRTTFYLPSCE